MPQASSFALFCIEHCSIRRLASIAVVCNFLLFFGVVLCVHGILRLPHITDKLGRPDCQGPAG